MSIAELYQYIGRPYSDLPANLEVHQGWPVVDRETLVITDVVLADETEGYTTADIVDGVIVTGDHYVAFLVAE